MQYIDVVQLFEMVRSALDQTLTVLCHRKGLTEIEAQKKLVEHLQGMSNQWYSGLRPTIAYDDPLCRLAYLYCHVAVNSNLFERCIRETPHICEYLNSKLSSDGLRICGFGGGPGTELLGLAKHISKTFQLRSMPSAVALRYRSWPFRTTALLP